MKRAALALLAVVAVGAGVVLTDDSDPGPIPTCNGEPATHVLVKHGTVGDYQEWTDAGVNVVSDPDNAFRGTWGHDVMVSLVETNAGGFISEPLKTPTSPKPSAGDFMCSFLKNSDDIYYATHGRADVIIDKGGSDQYYLGGCQLEGEGSPGDRKCDVTRSSGDDHDNVNSYWGQQVPRGRVQKLFEGDGMDHNYVGKGQGTVRIDGGDAPAHVNGGGDHVHPCPVNSSDPKYLSGLEGGFTKDKIVTTDIEYFGPESEFLPLNQVNDPCAYQQRDL